MIGQMEEVLPLEFFLSTIGGDSVRTARKYGLGLEIAEFCTAANMDDDFSRWDTQVRGELEGIPGRIFHGPFNELFPCAVDPKARELAAARYRQAIALAKAYGAEKIVIHGGFHPFIYYTQWYVEQSVAFWKDFLKEDPGVEIVLENVLEPEPEMLRDVVSGVAHPGFHLCLDVGHVNAYSKRSPMEWLEILSPWLSHFHLHNNDGTRDAHSALMMGTIAMEALLNAVRERCENATCTLELQETEGSVEWLRAKGFR